MSAPPSPLYIALALNLKPDLEKVSIFEPRETASNRALPLLVGASWLGLVVGHALGALVAGLDLDDLVTGLAMGVVAVVLAFVGVANYAGFGGRR